MSVAPGGGARSTLITTLVLLAAGLAAHAWLGAGAIEAQSPAFDEPLQLHVGRAWWTTGDLGVNGRHHPPLPALLAATALWGSGARLPYGEQEPPDWRDPAVQYGLSAAFVHVNGTEAAPDRIIDRGRVAVLTVSCLFLLALWLAVRASVGTAAAWGAFVAGALSPTWLAHASILTTDMVFACCFFLFFTSFARWGQSPTLGRATMAGAWLGASFAAKFSAVAIGPILVLWLVWRRLMPGRWRPLPWHHVLPATLGAVVVLALVYRFTGLTWFIGGLTETLTRVQEGRASFLLGHHSSEGWPYYFAAVISLKTPAASLAGLAVAIWLFATRRLSLPWQLWLPPLTFFVIASLAPVHIGHRHVLPIYPFLFCWLGAAAAVVWRGVPGRALVVVLGLALAATSALARPSFLPFVNAPARAAAPAHELLADSNLDWGQGLRALRTYLEARGDPRVYLSYFGSMDPAGYGIRHSAVVSYGPGHKDPRDAPGPDEPLLLAISVTNYHGVYHRRARPALAFLHERTPEAVIGDSILLFDLSNDHKGTYGLAKLLAGVGKPEEARALLGRIRR